MTEVPRIGTVLVAAAAACRAGVALAMIRSTLSARNPLTMVVQVWGSLEAFFTTTLTLSPRASFKASVKPWVAASSASCCTSCTTPTVKTCSSSFLLPQATIVRAMASARISVINFFILFCSFTFLLFV